MPYLPVVCLAVVHGLSLLMPVGENMHIAVVTRLFGWPLQTLPFHLACHAGTVLALLILLHREVGRLLQGAWQLLRGRWRPEAGLFVSLALALAPIGVLRIIGPAELRRQLRARPRRLPGRDRPRHGSAHVARRPL